MFERINLSDLEQDQTMTLTYDTHMYSCTVLLNYLYQLTVQWLQYFLLQKLIEKSGECNSHKPQPTPETKRKRKMTKTNTYKTNKQMHEKHTDQVPIPQARWSKC